MKRKNVIVIGAGIAGLASGRALAEAGESVAILESRNRVGGRIYTLRDSNEIFELGAEFVHGLPQELWQIIREANLRTQEVQGSQICYENGELKDCSLQWEQDFDPIEKLKEWRKPDCSFAEYLTSQNIKPERRDHLISYVEGFNAADHRIIGVASLGKQEAAEDAIEGDRAFHLCDGYSQIPEFIANKLLLAGGQISLNSHVESIAWQPGSVKVRCSVGGEPKSFFADRAVITLPLGVLQRNSVKFDPKPTAILADAASCRMGHVRRVDLLFRERFWAEWKGSALSLQVDDLSFLFAFRETPSTWWTQFPTRNGRLTGWVGGPGADRLANINVTELGKRACVLLSRFFGLAPENVDRLLLKCHSHDWQRDPLCMGAYSYLPAGAISLPGKMCIPVNDTLFFAGEHTDPTGHWGTVDAALRSGLRAAKQILET